jgi:hypothetical protein
MKKYTLPILLILSAIVCRAQDLSDFGRIVLNTYLPEKIEMPSEAKNQLHTKLSQIASNNGMGGSQVNPRFIITAKVSVGTKNIIAGPPQMIAQNMDLTLFIGDAINNTIFANATLSLKGVGINENKAFIDAFKNINPKNKELATFLEEGKNKILAYYTTNCDFILKEAQALVKQDKYNEAIYQLSVVPDVCKDCYLRCLDTIGVFFQKKIDAEGQLKLNEAKTIWAASQHSIGADRAGEILSTIHPKASCQLEVAQFVKTIESKLNADEKAALRLKMKELELNELQIKSYRDVALEYAKNQPKTVTYNNIYWW